MGWERKRVFKEDTSPTWRPSQGNKSLLNYYGLVVCQVAVCAQEWLTGLLTPRYESQT